MPIYHVTVCECVVQQVGAVLFALPAVGRVMSLSWHAHLPRNSLRVNLDRVTSQLEEREKQLRSVQEEVFPTVAVFGRVCCWMHTIVCLFLTSL